MKASVFTNYGTADFIELKEIDKATPRDDEILLKVFAAGYVKGKIIISLAVVDSRKL